MTTQTDHPIHDSDEAVGDIIEGWTRLSTESDCPTEGHSWQPSGDRQVETIRCERCRYSPHRSTLRAGTVATR
jgi:hypothetical protein